MIDFRTLRAADPEVAAAMEQELGRQRDHIELIASENFVSPAVMAGDGQSLNQQVCRGLSGQALLWRLPVRGHSGRSGARARVRSCSARIMPMYSRTRAHRPTLRYYFALLEPG